jgi:hypothetical protein
MLRIRSFSLLLSLFPGLVLSTALSAQDTPKPARTAPPPKTKAKPAASKAASPLKSTPARGGSIAAIDPDTGQLREPEAEEVQQLTAPSVAGGKGRARAAQAELPRIDLPGGGEAVKLDDSYLTYSVVTKNPDGTLKYEHAQGGRQARSKATQAGKTKEKTHGR